MGVAERVAVQRALVDRGPALADEVVATVVGQVPAYAQLTAPQLRETGAIASWVTGRLVEMWVDGGRLTPRDLERFRGIGAARAVDGRPLMAVLRAYRVAAVAVTDAIVGHAPPGLGIDDLAALVRVLVAGLDDLSEALLTGYEQKSGELATDRWRLVAELVHDLVTGRQTSPGALADRTERLGVTLPRTFGLLVAGPRDPASQTGSGLPAEQVHALAASVPALAGGGPDEHLAATRGSLAVVLVPDGLGRDEAGSHLATLGWWGCLMAGTTPADLPLDHRVATTALERAPDDALARQRVLDRADALTVAVLVGEPTVDRAVLTGAVLGPVLDERYRHLLEGLGAYLTHGSASAAAERLGLHPQSVRHRLRRLSELTGRRLDDPWDRLVLEMSRAALLTRDPRSGRRG